MASQVDVTLLAPMAIFQAAGMTSCMDLFTAENHLHHTNAVLPSHSTESTRYNE